MAGLVPGIYDLVMTADSIVVDRRDKPGDDGWGRLVAKLKVMCARSMHVAVGALGKAFAQAAAMRLRSTSALSAPCRASSTAARPPML